MQFWARGLAPNGTAKLSLWMTATIPTIPAHVGEVTGTCAGVADKTCIHPSYNFPVTAVWTLVQIPWTTFDPGTAVGLSTMPDGSNIWQIMWEASLNWTPDAAGAYVPIPGSYELEVDTLSFY